MVVEALQRRLSESREDFIETELTVITKYMEDAVKLDYGTRVLI